jgi:hypothetical protein
MFGFLKKKMPWASKLSEHTIDANVAIEVVTNKYEVTSGAVSQGAIPDVAEDKGLTLAQLQEDNQIQLAIVAQLREQLETIILSNQELKAQVDSLQSVNKKNQKDLEKKELDYKSKVQKLEEEKNQSAQKLKLTEVEKIKEIQEIINSSQDKNESLTKKNNILIIDKLNLSKKNEELIAENNKLKVAIEGMQSDYDSSAKAKIALLENDLQKITKEADSLRGDLSENKKESDLLLSQMLVIQEELVEYFDEMHRYENLYLTYKSRWDRLDERNPSYVDYEVLELVGFDNSSDTPFVTLCLKDFAQGEFAISDFLFQVIVEEGNPGVSLMTKEGGKLMAHPIVVPKLVLNDPKRRQDYLGISNSQYRQFSAAILMLTQLESSQWLGRDFINEIDLPFWRPFIRQLIQQWTSLPNVIRFDVIKLKRELINQDYEHLWLEIYGLSYGKRNWKKFEIRLSAASVEQDNFSDYPKYEIPLIDGKFKPFDSWFAESHDDWGPKFEMRFAVKKNQFDLATFRKLSDGDRDFLIRLIYLVPSALLELKNQSVAINRSWETWIEFSKLAPQLIENLQKEQKTTSDKAKEGQIIEQKKISSGSQKNRNEKIIQVSSGVRKKVSSKRKS